MAEEVKETEEIIETEEVISEEDIETTAEENLHKVFNETNEPLKSTEAPTLKPEEPTPGEEDLEADPDEEDGPTPAEKAEEEKIVAEQKAAEETAEGKESEEKAKDEEPDKSGEQEEVPQLSDAYYQAAIRRGWSQEDIKELYEANPKMAVKTFSNIYETLNRSSKEFADIGRAQKQMAEEAAKAPAASETTGKAEETSEYKGLDINQLRKDYPDDALIDLIEGQQEQSKILYDEVQTLKTTKPVQASGQPAGLTPEQQRAFEQETAAINQQIEGFFKGDELKGYTDFYGTVPKGDVEWVALTPGEKANRWEVIKMMDDLIVGAKYFGREMKIDEAMHLAHLSVSEPLREKVIRENIMKSVETRSKSITLKPSSTAKLENNKPTNTQELEDVTESRLAKLSW